MKAKVFEEFHRDLDVALNEWLVANPGIEILFTSQSGNSKTNQVTLTIIYRLAT